MGRSASSTVFTESAPRLTMHHARRLRAIYRSSGWPCQDTLEIELLVARLVERVAGPRGIESLRVTDAGLDHLHAALLQNRKAFSAHEALVAKVAAAQIRNGRIAYQGLCLFTKPAETWMQLKPDVFSIRNSSRDDALEPVIHEIKVSRADLRCDLKKPEKRAGYIAISSECYYVLAPGVGTVDDVPPECGVIFETASGLEMARLSPRRPMTLGFTTWMALAKSRSFECCEEIDAML